MAKKLTVAEQIAEYERKIDESVARWNHLLKHGGSDPFWPDGTNMNLVRNHVIYYLHEIAELDCSPRQMSMFDSPSGEVDVMNDPRIPRKVNDWYMATDRKLNCIDEELKKIVRVPW